MVKLNGPLLPPRSGAPARQAVILLHGYGADGSDLISLGQHWVQMLPDAMFVVSFVKKSPQGAVRSSTFRSGFCFLTTSICALRAAVSSALPAHMSTTIASPSPGPPVLGMLIYSAAITLYLAYLGLALGLTGALLWPAVFLHLVLSFLLGRAWLSASGVP